MPDTTLILKSATDQAATSAGPGSKKYSARAVREAFQRLLINFKDPERTLQLVAKSCGMPADEVRRILEQQSPPQVQAAQDHKDPTKRLIAPDPAAMLALRHFALREQTVNATVLAVIHQAEGELTEAKELLKQQDFSPLPLFDHQNEYQRAVMIYVGKVLEANPHRLAAGARNVLTEGAEEKVGHSSSPGVPLDTSLFAELLAPLKAAARQRLPAAIVHYISLPPLDLRRMTHTSHTLVIASSPVPPDTATVPLITADFLRVRSRDLVFVEWVAKRWPDGGKLEEVVEKIEFADWLISLLSYTLYSSHKLEGKLMLVKLACLCAARAQRFAPSAGLRHFLAAAERWTEEPSEEHRELADRAKDEIRQPLPEESQALSGAAAYAFQAAKEATMRAVSAAAATDPTRVSSHVARAAAAAVMAATFAGNSDTAGTWLSMVNARTATDEAREQKALCDAIRAIIKLRG